MVRERYNKVRMNCTNTATKAVQTVSRCCELAVSDSSSVGRILSSLRGHGFKSCLSDLFGQWYAADFKEDVCA